MKDSTLIPAINPLNRTPALVDILIQIEDVIDSLDMYAYDNWIDGSIAYGPYMRRHWIEIGLFYPWKKMPDPSGALRLIKYGVKVNYKKIKVPVITQANGEISKSPGIGTLYDMPANVPPPADLPIRLDPRYVGLKDMERARAPIVNYNVELDHGRSSDSKKKNYTKGWIVSLAIPARFIEQRYVSALMLNQAGNIEKKNASSAPEVGNSPIEEPMPPEENNPPIENQPTA